MATTLGVASGVAGTAALSQILRRALYGISGVDPLSYISAISLLAALIPIRRAFHLDVARILHFE